MLVYKQLNIKKFIVKIGILVSDKRIASSWIPGNKLFHKIFHLYT